MEKGKVVSLKPEGAYGFIRWESTPNDLFFHKNMIASGVTWNDLEVGHTVVLRPVQGDRGMIARDVRPLACGLVKLDALTADKSMQELIGHFGMMTVFRAAYTNPEKQLEGCEGLAFCGADGFGDRFPANQEMIGMLMGMRAVFDKTNTAWFLREESVPSSAEKIRDLIVLSERLRRQQKQIRKPTPGFIQTIVSIAQHVFSGVAGAAYRLAGRTKASSVPRA